jgi:hypothetical protein
MKKLHCQIASASLGLVHPAKSSVLSFHQPLILTSSLPGYFFQTRIIDKTTM